MPKAWPIHCVTTPERPSNKITDKPMTKGGVMMGSSDRDLKKPLKGTRVRVSTSANARPSTVLPSPTATARASEFQATPH